jgi:hypothetical protein
MALKESFETYDGTGFSIYGTSWRAQTFTTTSAYLTTAVALYGWKYGSPGNVTVSIRAVDDDGKPTGDDLCYITVSDDVLSALPTMAWHTFTFSSSHALDDDTQYAIIIRAPSGNGGNYYAPFGYSSSGYAGGGSVNGDGSIWGEVSATKDINFRVYGEEIPLPGKPTNPLPVNDATDITLDQSPLSWDASDPAADTYEIYFREEGDEWELVGEAQEGIEWTVDFGTLEYGITYEWRVDATNEYGTTTGDTWSFSAIYYNPPLPAGITLDWDADPPGQPTGNPTGENNMYTVKRLIVAANNKIFYEDI